jgi:adenosylhomocysteine nucleosidase
MGDKMKIGIIVAIDAENRNIKSSMSDVRERIDAGNKLTIGRIALADVIICLCGMGTVNAAAATQLLISKYGAEVIMFSGIAGNLNPKLKLGDVIIGQTLRYLDTDVDVIAEHHPRKSEFASTPYLVEAAQKAARALGVNAILGTIATGNRFVTGKEASESAKSQTGADAVEMEGAAIAHIAEKNGVDFLIIRSMSDNCDETYEEFSARTLDIDAYAKAAAELVIKIVHEIAH